MFASSVFVIAPIPLTEDSTEEMSPLVYATLLTRQRQDESHRWADTPVRYRIGPLNKLELNMGLSRFKPNG